MKYYCIKQHDITDCGAACLATICKQNGYKIGITRIREVAGTDKQGTNVYGIIKAAEELGFSAKGVKGNKEAFFSDFPLPCIAHVIVDGNLLHYVVIHKITKKQIIIADPGVGIVKLTPEEFFGEVHKEGKAPKYQWSGVLILLVKSDSFQTGDETKGLFQRFIHLLLPQKKLIVHIFAASLIYTLLGILAAFYFKVLVDDILPDSLMKTLTTLSIGIIVLNIFKVILNAFRTHLLLYLSQKLDIALLLGYYRHVLELPMNFFGTRKVGEIVSRFNDASKVRDAISGATLTIMIDTLMAVGGAIILYLQNAQMFGITVIMVLLYLIIVLTFNKWYEQLNRKQMEDNAQLTSYLVESLNGIQTVKAYNAERKVNRETEIKFVKLLKSIFDLSWVSNLQSSLKTFVELVGGVVILWVGSVCVIKGQITIGQLITFNSLLVYFLDPVKNLINLQPQMQTAIVAADRLGEILDLEAEKGENERKKLCPETLAGDIVFKNINFRYGTRQLVLENINFTIKKGQKVAFVGESGSGKTTLLKLLLGQLKPTEGVLSRVDFKYVYVDQECSLLRDNLTVYEQVERFNEQNIPEHELKMRLNRFLFPREVWDKPCCKLSGGERMRLVLCCLMIGNNTPDVFVLDEPTNNLDILNIEIITSTIKDYRGTVIAVSHDRSFMDEIGVSRYIEV